MIENDVRYQIDRILESKGWILGADDNRRNVFFEGSVKIKLTSRTIRELGAKRPDYTLFDGHIPLAIIEAKKTTIRNLEDALDQAKEYAHRLQAKIVFASNGTTVKTRHLPTNRPLFINNVEVNELLSLEDLLLFHHKEDNRVFTLPTEVIRSRDELIRLFEELNSDLRAEGLRNGMDRFSELANILFLKLLSEKGDDLIWKQLIALRNNDILAYLNKVAIVRLRENYGGEVITETAIRNPITMKNIVNTLNPLQLTAIDEDIKGVAFEKFIQRTTGSRQNDLGEYFTPRHIVRFMVKLLNPKYGESVYDPFCGTGGFLTETFRHIGQQSKVTKDSQDTLFNKTVFGGEITTTARIAKMNMILFGDGHSGVSQQDSLRTNCDGIYDNVLSNIPFSQRIPQDLLRSLGGHVQNGDEACVLKCFNSLKAGGSMAVVVPEGLLVNRSEFLRWLLMNSRIRMLVRLPGGCFSPYTEVRTGIIYLTDKGVAQTDWFYQVVIKNDGFDSRRQPIDGINDLDQVLFFYGKETEPQIDTPDRVEISRIAVRNVGRKGSFSLHIPWQISSSVSYRKLIEISILRNGKSITEKDVTDGNIPVIAGGRGTIPYFHGESNSHGGVFTISKSGAYAGYVWWHDHPIWASDSIVVKSKDETRFLTQFLYLCMRNKQKEIYERQQGTGQPHIYKSHIEDFPIPDISVNQQRKIVEEFQERHTALQNARKKARIQERVLEEYLSEFGHAYFLDEEGFASKKKE